MRRRVRRHRVMAFGQPGFGHSERSRRRVWTFAAQADVPREGLRLTMPVIILTGTDDRIVAGRLQSQRLHERIPGSVFRERPGVGHMIHHAAPDTAVAAIERAAGAAEV